MPAPPRRFPQTFASSISSVPIARGPAATPSWWTYGAKQPSGPEWVPPGYVWLVEAVERIGAARFGDQWVSRETRHEHWETRLRAELAKQAADFRAARSAERSALLERKMRAASPNVGTFPVAVKHTRTPPPGPSEADITRARQTLDAAVAASILSKRVSPPGVPMSDRDREAYFSLGRRASEGEAAQANAALERDNAQRQEVHNDLRGRLYGDAARGIAPALDAWVNIAHSTPGAGGFAGTMQRIPFNFWNMIEARTTLDESGAVPGHLGSVTTEAGTQRTAIMAGHVFLRENDLTSICRESARSTIGARTACKRWLTELSAGTKMQSKDGYWQQAAKDFPGLSRRQFDAAWDEVVPSAWRRQGAPRKPRSETPH
jgi:hypothetical protein